MVIGRFGGAKFDKICVLSIDGELLFLDQHDCIFRWQLDGFLLPGPLTYCPRSDLFFTCNSSFDLQCYDYQSIAAAHQAKSAITVKNRSAPNWKLCIGEAALQILTVETSSPLSGRHGHFVQSSSKPGSTIFSDIQIVLLSSQSLFVLSRDGQLIFHQRFNFTAVLCNAVLSPSTAIEDSGVNLLIVDTSGCLMIYRNMQIVWASRCDGIPVALSIVPFRNVDGHVILLSKNGALCINNLGTEPANRNFGVSGENLLDYGEMQHEINKISTSKRASNVGQKVNSAAMVKIEVQIGESSEMNQLSSTTKNHNEASRRTELRVFVTATGSESLQNITVMIRTPAPVICQDNCISIPLLPCGKDATIMVSTVICIPRDCTVIPTSSKASVIASYPTPSGEQHVAAYEVHLPLSFFCDIVPPEKNASHKVTLEMNYPPPRLKDLFEDILLRTSKETDVATTSDVMGFRHHSGDNVTVVVSKSAGRFRLQSTRYEPIWLVLSEVVKRLQSRYTGDLVQNAALRFVLHCQLPLQGLFSSLDAQEKARVEYSTQDSVLGCRARQLRAAQKRLLYRYNEKCPSCLIYLDDYIEKTCSRVITTVAKTECRHSALIDAGYSLAAATNYFLLLMKLRLNMNEAEMSTVRGHIPIHIGTSEEQTWNEWTCVAVMMLFKSLRKSASGKPSEWQHFDRTQMIGGNVIQTKKQIALLVDRFRRHTGEE